MEIEVFGGLRAFSAFCEDKMCFPRSWSVAEKLELLAPIRFDKWRCPRQMLHIWQSIMLYVQAKLDIWLAFITYIFSYSRDLITLVNL